MKQNRFDPEKHHRRSIRLQSHDYASPGAYFVTLVTWQREYLFGEIIGDEMKLNEFGKIITEEWKRTAIIRPYIDLDEYIVMPNHLHGILVISSDSPHVGASRRLAPTTPTAPSSGSLGAIMAQFKSIVTKRINRLRGMSGTPVWQRDYYEHIIRNDLDAQRIRDYILNNPLNWRTDEEHIESNL